jgi:hypothetical protein
MLYKEQKVNKEKKLQMAPVSFKEGRGEGHLIRKFLNLFCDWGISIL